MFVDEEDPLGLSRVAYQFMAGILNHIKEITVLTNPLVNSYKRLVPGYDAPIYIAWSAASNRSPLIRVPSSRGNNTRIELRCPDSAVNPYLALAACLGAGLDGILNKIDPHANGWGPYDFNLFTLSDEEKKQIQGLPKSLGEALDALEADHAYLTAGGVFPEELIYNWIRLKRAEEEEISRIPTPAEFQRYYAL